MLHFGTMGFSYSDWAGVFYPKGVKPGQYLAFYAQQFDAVELDTTFHAVPPPERARKWAEQVPDHFRFCAKMPRTVTHDVQAPESDRLKEMERFIEAMRPMGNKLAVLLVQFPPSCGIEGFEFLARLLRSAPREVRYAVEFRNATWGRQRTLDLLREHRAALVAAEYLTRPQKIHVTADFLYLRMIGEHDRFEELNREQMDVDPSLDWWQQELQSTLAAHPIADVWTFFNNDYSGYAVTTCRRFMRRLGVVPREDPTPPPLPPDPDQPTLF